MSRLTEKFLDTMQGIMRYSTKSKNIELNTGGDDFEEIVEKLGKYEDMEEQGVLFVAPCKIGTIVYEVVLGEIMDFTLVGYAINDEGMWLMRMEYEFEGRIYTKSVETEKIGITEFLSYQEAEARRKEVEKLKKK